MVVIQVDAANVNTPLISRETFMQSDHAYTMTEVYGSDLMGFSAGGFIWASEMKMQILTPAANLVGSYYRGTIQYGQLGKHTYNSGLSIQ